MKDIIKGMPDAAEVLQGNFTELVSKVSNIDDVNLVHKNGEETIPGNKTFSGINVFENPIDGSLKVQNLAANTDLNNIRTSGVYDSGDNAETFKNGITDPSMAKGHPFILTVTTNYDGTFTHQDLKADTGWAFTRNLYMFGSEPVVTSWIAYAGSMHVSIPGPFGSTLTLLRSANTVTFNMGGMSGPLTPGAESVEKIPLDYVPMCTRKDIGGIPGATITSYWANTSLAVIKSGALHNFGGSNFEGEAIGTWLIQY